MQQQPSLYGMPLFLSTFVPMGLMGLLVAAIARGRHVPRIRAHARVVRA